MVKIAIVGRPNVGKSTLFNRLAGRKLALVDDRPGVTRDRRFGTGRLGDIDLEMIDTAGFEDIDGESRTMLKLHPQLAPVKAAVLPLVKKDGQPEIARELFDALKPLMQTEYDESGSIGKRYRRHDEIGTPYCLTIDHQTLEDRTVTVRDRDSLSQERLAIDELAGEFARRLAQPWRSPKLDE